MRRSSARLMRAVAARASPHTSWSHMGSTANPASFSRSKRTHVGLLIDECGVVELAQDLDDERAVRVEEVHTADPRLSAEIDLAPEGADAESLGEGGEAGFEVARGRHDSGRMPSASSSSRISTVPARGPRSGQSSSIWSSNGRLVRLRAHMLSSARSTRDSGGLNRPARRRCEWEWRRDAVQHGDVVRFEVEHLVHPAATVLGRRIVEPGSRHVDRAEVGEAEARRPPIRSSRAVREEHVGPASSTATIRRWLMVGGAPATPSTCFVSCSNRPSATRWRSIARVTPSSLACRTAGAPC